MCDAVVGFDSDGSYVVTDAWHCMIISHVSAARLLRLSFRLMQRSQNLCAVLPHMFYCLLERHLGSHSPEWGIVSEMPTLSHAIQQR
jgi:hypothetical protein